MTKGKGLAMTRLVMLLLKIPATQGIIAESEANPEISNQTSGRMQDTNKPVQEILGSDRLKPLYNRDLKM